MVMYQSLVDVYVEQKNLCAVTSGILPHILHLLTRYTKSNNKKSTETSRDGKMIELK